jgi:UPF0288 family protein (methanogenesis marker protein 3)
MVHDVLPRLSKGDRITSIDPILSRSSSAPFISAASES